MNRHALTTILLATCVASVAHAQWNVPSPPVYVTPDHADAIYKAGETIRWTVDWQKEGDVPSGVRYTLRSGGQKEIGGGELTFSGKTAHFDATLDEANTILATVSWDGGGPGKQSFGGAVVEPFKIQPAAAEPDDFQSFWDGKLAELKKIAPNPQLVDGESGNPAVKYAKVTLDNINGTKVQGQIARPASGEKFPAILVLQYAGVYPLQKGWAVDRAKDGWLALNIEAHDIAIDEKPDYYAKLNGGELQNYWKIGNTDKNTSYYLRMYLGVAQSIAYLQSRPDWDGKTLVLMGGSQGGQQTLAGAGLCPDAVTAALPFVPAASDNWAESIGRHSGFPFWWNQVDNRDADAVRTTSKYFDPVYFAKRVKCPVLTGTGLRDDLAPPSSVLAVYNQITSPKEIVILPKAGHVDEKGSQQPYQDKVYGTWLPALKRGEMPAIAK